MIGAPVLIRPKQIPLSTYRLQFGPNLGFAAACELVPYLAQLGIGHAYASPLFRACENSSHGYDVVDHRQFDPELGTEEDFQTFAEVLAAHQMGLMLDVVPNHMGIDDAHNVWWQDVLENGISSVYAKFFDVDWDPPKQELKQKVLLPILGDQYGRILEKQELKLVYDDQRFQIAYYNRRFPIAPRTWADILRLTLNHVAEPLDASHPQRMELESIILELDNLPPQSERDPDGIQLRYREKEVARRRLTTLLDNSEPIRRALEQAIDDFNGRLGEPASFDRLEDLLSKQAYRLCHWRVATDEINYRRFFDINELAAIRVEDPDVFSAVHERLFRSIEQGWVTALRIDHPDGLFDPQRYFEQIQNHYIQMRRDSTADDLSRAGIYIAVEKILAHDESLPADWPVAGTTGYDFLNLLNGLFVSHVGGLELRSVYLRFIGENWRFADVVYDSKKLILNVSMSSELHVLAGHLDRISEQHRFSRDFTGTSLRRALREAIACFTVYRTYIQPETNVVSEEDRRRIVMAMRFARRRNPVLSPSFFDFIASILLLEHPEGLSEADIQERHQFIRKFQQLTGPVMAKGLEDTAFYRYYPLASLNEVGGDPTVIGTSPEQFHRANTERGAAWPNSMLTTATHDTKRGEDVRARLNVLSEIPSAWEEAVVRWQGWNEGLHVELDSGMAPDANEEYLFYQTLVGTWPLNKLADAERDEYVQRIVRYMEKAMKEAKTKTSWLSPYAEFDEAVAGFVRSALDPQRSEKFLADLDNFVRGIANAGFLNSLAQTLLKLCAPGVPDLYQGNELWDFHLVDPDNRQPVDFATLRKILDDLIGRSDSNLAELADDLLRHWPDPRIKMFLIWRTLLFRRDHAELFAKGAYMPLEVTGNRSEHVFAFARHRDDRWAITVVPRLSLDAWRNLALSEGRSSLARKPIATSRRQPAPAGAPTVQRSSKKSRGAAEPSSGTAAEVWPLAAWWRETFLRVPVQARGEWLNVLSGQWIAATSTEGPDRMMAVDEIFRSFPVALLEG